MIDIHRSIPIARALIEMSYADLPASMGKAAQGARWFGAWIA
jgi:hypothetical protein